MNNTQTANNPKTRAYHAAIAAEADYAYHVAKYHAALAAEGDYVDRGAAEADYADQLVIEAIGAQRVAFAAFVGALKKLTPEERLTGRSEGRDFFDPQSIAGEPEVAA